MVLVAGAGVSRASGMPGWSEMVATIQNAASKDLSARLNGEELEGVLASLHDNDPISRADSLQRLMKTTAFNQQLHAALYGGLRPNEKFRPSIVHWHIASLVDRARMPDVFTSNYDDLLEDAKRALGRSGRIRHFHGRLPQDWSGATRLGDRPVVTSRDYMAAEDEHRYARFSGVLANKTALLVGFSLSDPNLARIIRNQARDCRAILVASPGTLTPAQQALRLDLLRRYWLGLNIAVTAIEAHEELPAFLLALRREVLIKNGRSLCQLGESALNASAVHSPWTLPGAYHWRTALKEAVAAGRAVAGSLAGDRSLRAGFYAIAADGALTHLVSSDSTRRSYTGWPRRRLLADDVQPWGAAGYCYAAGVPISSSATGAAFDRNVPETELLAWQTERARQGRLPAASVLCVPAWVKHKRDLVPAGVLYFSSRRGAAFDPRADAESLRVVLQLTFAAMIKPDRVVEGGLP
ncbi:MAG: SIR2 family protein [Candidatus Limnocylindrales bacterium]